MINPKYEIGYIFKDKRGYTYEVIDRNFNGSVLIYFVRSIDSGIVFVWLEGEIDNLIGGANAKKPRKK